MMSRRVLHNIRIMHIIHNVRWLLERRHVVRRAKNTTPDHAINELTGFSATDLAKSVSEVTREVMKRGAAVITRHDEPVMVVLSVDRYRQLQKAAAPNLDALTRDFDAMYARMQTPGVAEKTVAALDLGATKGRRPGHKKRTRQRSARQRG